jgi:hypothetical protein
VAGPTPAKTAMTSRSLLIPLTLGTNEGLAVSEIDGVAEVELEFDARINAVVVEVALSEAEELHTNRENNTKSA